MNRHMHLIGRVLLVWIACNAFPSFAQDCTNPDGDHGVITYNQSFGTFQGCSPGGWVALNPLTCPLGDSCDPCSATSPAPGTVCLDGSIYAGMSPDGNVKMLTTRCDEGQTWNGTACSGTRVSLPWNNGINGGYVATGRTSTLTGEANTAALDGLDSDNLTGGNQPHQAAQRCADLTTHGKSDWYLPARQELNVLYLNRGAITNFSTNHYYSSTEDGNHMRAWFQQFSDGVQQRWHKYGDLPIRCVRKYLAQAQDCTAPDGDYGVMVYNADFGVWQGCGPRGWVALNPLACPLGDGCDPCADASPPPGVVCRDGTIFAGMSPDGNVKMFTTRCDAGQSWDGGLCTGSRLKVPWNNGNNIDYVEVGAGSNTAGSNNTAMIVGADSDNVAAGNQPHQAAQHCADLSVNGRSDWYLPAEFELDVLFSNRVAIGNFDLLDDPYAET